MDKTTYEHHRKRLVECLPPESAAVLFSGSECRKSGDVFYEFFANRDFFYLTGLNEANAIIVISKNECDEVREYLWVERRTEEHARWFGKRPNSESLEQQTGLPIYNYTENFSTWLNTFLQKNDYVIYLDLHDAADASPAYTLAETVRGRFPWIRFGDLHSIVSRLREIKSDAEIRAMKQGITVAKDAVIKLMEQAKPGMSEYQLKALWDYTVSWQGVRDMAFQPIITSGENNFIIHYSAYTRTIRPGDVILLDAGVNWDGLCCDISRAWPVDTWFTEEEELFYRCMLECSRDLFNYVKPGIQMRDVYRMQRRIMRKRIVEFGLVPDEERANRLIWHGGAHHIGYDNHDEVHISSHESRCVEPNMVFAIDIGLYDLEKNIGFRLEDDCLVTENGSENLTAEIPRQLDELRAILDCRY